MMPDMACKHVNVLANTVRLIAIATLTVSGFML